jgi:hypothetical protein
MTIAETNDILRSRLPFLPRPHQFVMSAAVAALPPAYVSCLFAEIRAFNNFDKDNDPYGEHDFIKIKYKSEVYSLKVDYFDKNLEFYKEDGTRVFTLMNASDW